LDTRDAVLSSKFSHITKLLTSLPTLEGSAGTARACINGRPWIRKKYDGGFLEMELLSR
jgi:hypothetical protein